MRISHRERQLAAALCVAWAALPGCGDNGKNPGTPSAASSTGAGGASSSSGAGGGMASSSGTGGEGAGPPAQTVRFVGRFDTKDPSNPRFGWSGSEIITRFSGTSLGVRLADTSAADSSNFFEVVVDGKDQGKIQVNGSAELYTLAQGLPDGEHDLVLHKRTEGFVGPTTFMGFVPDLGKTLVPVAKAPDRRIEIIGDSISAGYGVDGADANCPFTTETENNWLAYGPVTARALGADANIIAWSGIGAYQSYGGDKTNTMKDVYGRTIPTEAGSAWDFASFVPHVVVINLGTNDFSVGDPGQPFVDAYGALVDRVRKNYPAATIFCALGPMLSDSYPAGANALTKARTYIKGVVDDRTGKGDAHIRFIEFPTQDGANGLGCDYHPSAKTQALMAAQLTAAIQKELGW
jgi:lysophospholipase L1-like esterase